MEYMDKSNEFKATVTTICEMCLKEKSRYICPRCNAPYCSVECYRCEGHAGCSEGFYKDCFMEGLRDMKSPGQKQEVMEMLKRVSEQNDPLDSDDDDEDLIERLEGLNLDKDTEVIWSRLNEREKAEFREMMRDGRLGELVDIWSPWWSNSKKKNLVEEISPDSDTPLSPARTTGEGAISSRIPTTIKTILDIDAILKHKEPSDTIQYNLINIIYAYAYISRLYNGEYHDVAEQSSQEMLLLSEALSVQTYKSTTEAIQACVHCLANQAKGIFVSLEFSAGILLDVQQIVTGPGPSDPLRYVMASISDIHHLFSNAIKALKKAKHKRKAAEEPGISPEGTTHHRQLRHKVHAVCKKCEFLLAWVHKYGATLQVTIPEIQIEFCEISSRLIQHQDTKQKLGQLKSHRPKGGLHKLIQEVLPFGECS